MADQGSDYEGFYSFLQDWLLSINPHQMGVSEYLIRRGGYIFVF